MAGFMSGDVVADDEDGLVFVTDRLKDIVMSEGECTRFRESEDALANHPGVIQVAVVGRLDVRRSESVLTLS